MVGKQCAQACEIFEHDDLLYVAMEYVPGKTLAMLLLEKDLLTTSS